MATTMENNGTGLLSVIVSMLSATFAWITAKDVQVYVSITAGLVAIVSGVFAIRHYYLSTKKLNK